MLPFKKKKKSTRIEVVGVSEVEQEKKERDDDVSRMSFFFILKSVCVYRAAEKSGKYYTRGASRARGEKTLRWVKGKATFPIESPLPLLLLFSLCPHFESLILSLSIFIFSLNLYSPIFLFIHLKNFVREKVNNKK